MVYGFLKKYLSLCLQSNHRICSVIVTHGVGQLRDPRVRAGAPLQVSVMWNHDLFVFGQVAVQLQHVGAEIHGAAEKKAKGTADWECPAGTC